MQKSRLLIMMLTIIIVIGSLGLLTGCGNTAGTAGKELALITDLGTIDDKSFNQGAWEGLKKYATEKGKTFEYYQPTEQSTTAYLDAIALAVTGGAKVIVTPGFLFEEPVFLAQDHYPDIKFILLDGSPNDGDWDNGPNFKTGSNTVGVTYAEHEAGFLAGYAAVKDGYHSLGFMGGMAVPAVKKFGYGFVQGAEYAAQELGLTSGAITIKYFYTGGFAATPEAQAMASSWYNDGVEVIFACGGAVGNSVMAAAEAAGKKVIGVDVDQAGESATVITSAMKELSVSVYDCITDYYTNKFPGGQDIVFTAANEGVGLPMTSSKFANFTQADYDAIYAKLAAKAIDIWADVRDGADVNIVDIPKSIVIVNEY
ncbi:MAG: BMP family ABC transporter substrate-binding protein [Firmicutes bacterium]|nr:BMP family ABC transporter substrate-binding protein [Bacillota bacterium]